MLHEYIVRITSIEVIIVAEAMVLSSRNEWIEMRKRVWHEELDR